MKKMLIVLVCITSFKGVYLERRLFYDLYFDITTIPGLECEQKDG